MCFFEAIHYLLPPNFFISTLVDQKKIKSKPTILDSVNGVFIEAECVNDVKVKINSLLEERKNKKTTLQPMIALILKDKLPNEIYVYVDGIFYKIASMLSAVDICKDPPYAKFKIRNRITAFLDFYPKIFLCD